ncbi:UNVERIFIED_CONTAM: hypothetical protein RMT77_004914 [Armadillidium vulgare]
MIVRSFSTRISNMAKVYVIGVGMTKFEKPGRREDFDYPDMARESVTKALRDAKVNYTDIEQACVGYVYGDSTCGQRALYEIGMTGIPVFNVNNNCSTGSTALLMGTQLIRGGNANCVLALGFEKMSRGSLTSVFSDRANPMEKHVEVLMDVAGIDASPMAAQLFGNAGLEHMRKYGTTEEHFAKIALKNHKHSVNNEYSQFRDEYSLDDIKKSPKIFGPLTKLQCCPTSDGSAAAILASENFVKEHGLENQAVEIIGIEMSTDLPSTFKEKDPMKLVGYDMTKDAVNRLYKKSGVSPQNIDVVELHDCFSANELITYEALGLCEEGGAGRFIDSNDNTYGGRTVVNPSGGLISKGHPLGATGLAQCSEICWQLRGQAGKRQVANAQIGLQHNIGLGGAVVVALYRLGFPSGQGSDSRKMVAGGKFKSEEIFTVIEDTLKTDGKNLIPKVKGIFSFKVTGGPGGIEETWIVDAKNGAGSVTRGGNGKSDVSITMTDDDLYDLMTGKMNAQKAFFQGKLKIKGNMGLAMKLQEFQKDAEALRSKL